MKTKKKYIRLEFLIGYKGDGLRERILDILRKNKKNTISGEFLAEELGISRTAVWKHINQLKKQGYNIISQYGSGYRLVQNFDVLNSSEISYELKSKYLGSRIKYFPEIDSTNFYAKRWAINGCEEGTVVVAGAQKFGRGRLGRLWDSPPGKGIWMSVVLRPEIAPADAQILTLAASCAVKASIEQIADIKMGLKWPNDLILDEKKASGILAEIDAEIEKVNFIVLGIGINVFQEKDDFPIEIRKSATSLKMFCENRGINATLNRAEIIKRILFELEKRYDKVKNGELTDIIKEWKESSVTLGRAVKFKIKNTQYEGVAEDINEKGMLVIKCGEKEKIEILSGEISVRGLMGYI